MYIYICIFSQELIEIHTIINVVIAYFAIIA